MPRRGSSCASSRALGGQGSSDGTARRGRSGWPRRRRTDAPTRPCSACSPRRSGCPVGRSRSSRARLPRQDRRSARGCRRTRSRRGSKRPRSRRVNAVEASEFRELLDARARAGRERARDDARGRPADDGRRGRRPRRCRCRHGLDHVRARARVRASRRAHSSRSRRSTARSRASTRAPTASASAAATPSP